MCSKKDRDHVGKTIRFKSENAKHKDAKPYKRDKNKNFRNYEE